MTDFSTMMPESAKPQKQPWGFLATLGFCLIIFLVYTTIQSVSLLIFGYFYHTDNPGMGLEELINSLAFNGSAIAFSVIPGNIAATGLIFLFSHMKTGLSYKDYLDLNPVPLKSLLLWIGLMGLLLIATEAVNYFVDRPVPEWMTQAYQTADYRILFFIAVILGAPLFEEFFFRGFLFEGLRYTWIGTHGTILITAAIWASIHLQYEAFEIGYIFIFGILLGYAKVMTNSIYTPLLLHIIANAIATVQIAYLLS